MRTLQDWVERSAAQGVLVVQPRMGFSDPQAMRDGIERVSSLSVASATTLTLDSYTRVGRHDLVQQALANGDTLNGYPIVDLPDEVTRAVVAAAGDHPIQVRHGSADPRGIFHRMGQLGLFDTEGGPASYCLPYSRTPLSVATNHWKEASQALAEAGRRWGVATHIETFGGCMLGQICPPELLVAISVLEALFFQSCGLTSLSLSLTQQTSAEQDVAALRALRQLASEVLSPQVRRHVVLYTYMGLFPATAEGASLLCDRSIDVAKAGGADRVIVKTQAEAHRIPTVEENLAALRRAASRAQHPKQVVGDPTETVLDNARRIVDSVLHLSADPGDAIVAGFASGLLDVPFCLHPDNARRASSRIDQSGRIRFVDPGSVPVAMRTGGTMVGRAIRSEDLLQMLGKVSTISDQAGSEALRVAIIGGGPRGLSVLERLVVQAESRPLFITLIDPQQQPGGRIWQPTQPRELLMNTPASEVTMFSGPGDVQAACAGSGPTLGQWLDVEGESDDRQGDFATRSAYGRYLAYFMNSVVNGSADHVHVSSLVDECVDVRPQIDGGHLLELRSGMRLEADVVVLATGHPRFAGPTRKRWITADSAADLNLRAIQPGDMIGVRGMGLSFFDVLALLTTGRGGKFRAHPAGGPHLEYLPSGLEPVVMPGSRSGIPIPGRGINQKGSGWVHDPLFVTDAWVDSLKARESVQFAADVEPTFVAEAQALGAEALIRRAEGPEAAARFRALVKELPQDRDLPSRVLGLAEVFTSEPVPVIDIEALARPFANATGPSGWTLESLLAWVDDDLEAALGGNVLNPLKAALDAFRDTRQQMMRIVDHCGLDADGHTDYLRRYVPRVSLLSAGPPARRLAEFSALVRAGIVRPLGPGVNFGANDTGPVATSLVLPEPVAVDWVVDARIPAPSLPDEQESLLAALRDSGLVRQGRNQRGGDLPLGGIDVLEPTSQVVDVNGQAVPGLFAIGIPTEGKRWFTQVGSGRPNGWNSFHVDADRIATSVMSNVRKSVGVFV